MSEPAKKTHRGDSFVVHVTRPASAYPMVRIIRRSRRRQPGRVSEERTIGVFGGKEEFEQGRIEELAKEIGLAILGGSPIIRAWRSGKHVEPSQEDRATLVLRDVCNRGGRVTAREFQDLTAHFGYDPRGAGVLFKNYLRRAGDEVVLTDAGYDRVGDIQLLPSRKRAHLPEPIRLPGKPLSAYVSEGRE